MTSSWALSPDRCFSAEPSRRALARELHKSVESLPIIGPHGHVNPALLADPEATLGTPAELFIIPDHYVFRMLYSQGVRLEELGVPTEDGTRVESDHRRIWRRFAEGFHLFRGTPTGLWLADELTRVFGVSEKPSGGNADRLFDELSDRLARPEFSPRALFERFNIEVLCTTDAATDRLEHHQSLFDEGWEERIRPTFRPDAVVNLGVNLGSAGWRESIDRLSECSGSEVVDYASFIRALEDRRAFFKKMGAKATDHAALTPQASRLSEQEAAALFGRALAGSERGGCRPLHRPHAHGEDASEMAHDFAYRLAKRAYRLE